jgi:hypothetical protein
MKQAGHIKKNIINKEIGGFILGYWTGIDIPKYKIYGLLQIRNRFVDIMLKGFRIKWRIADRRCRYIYPRWWATIKSIIYLFYVNFLKQNIRYKHFLTFEEREKYIQKTTLFKVKHRDTEYTDRRGRVWEISQSPVACIVHKKKRYKHITIIGTFHSHIETGAKPSSIDNWTHLQQLKNKDKALMGIMHNGIMNIYLKEKKYYNANE